MKGLEHWGCDIDGRAAPLPAESKWVTRADLFQHFGLTKKEAVKNFRIWIGDYNEWQFGKRD